MPGSLARSRICVEARLSIEPGMLELAGAPSLFGAVSAPIFGRGPAALVDGYGYAVSGLVAKP